MIKYVNEESSWESYTTDNEPFNWFPSVEDEDNMDFVAADNYENPIDNIMWSTGDEIIDAIDSHTFEPWKVDSKIQELTWPDWTFDFMWYTNWLDTLPVELRKEVDDYVYSKYSRFFENDDVWWIEPMKSSNVREEDIPHYVVKNPNRKKELYDTLDDYDKAA